MNISAARAYLNRLTLTIFVLIALIVLSPKCSRAGELYIYEHNGSIIDWFVVGNRITATYETPRLGLAEAGIKPGTILFEGEYEGARIVGTAYTFKRGCRPAPYNVIGYEDRKRIILDGPVPVRSGCTVAGFSATRPNARLVLKYSATHH